MVEQMVSILSKGSVHPEFPLRGLLKKDPVHGTRILGPVRAGCVVSSKSGQVKTSG